MKLPAVSIPDRFKKPVTILFFLFLIAGIYLFFNYRFNSAAEEIKEELLTQTRIVEKVVFWRRLREVKGVIADTSQKGYKELQGQLDFLITGNSKYSAAYIIGKKEDITSFYYNYVSKEKDKNNILPGTTINPRGEIEELFSRQGEKVFGPYSKEGKRVITAAITLIYPLDKKLAGVFAIDQSAESWDIMIIEKAVLPVIIPILLLGLVLKVSLDTRNRAKAKRKLELSEQSLKEAQYKFDKVMSVLEDVIYVVDAETEEFSYLSPAFEKLFGYSALDIHRMGGRKAFLSKVIQDKHFKEQEDFFRRLKSSHMKHFPDWVTWWKCADGTLLLIEDRWIEVYDEGQFIGTYGILRNITERNQKEEELEKEKLLMHTLMENIPDSIYFKDKESRYIRANRAVCNLFGLKNPVEIEGRRASDFLSEEYAQKVRLEELKIVETGEPLLGVDEKESWLDGTEKWVSSTKMPLRDANGAIIGTFGISRDITERKIAEEQLKKNEIQLRELNSMKDKLFSVVAHDLKNPFFNIMEFVNSFADDFESLSEIERKEMLKHLKLITDNGYSLLENLLTWSRIQLNKINPDLKEERADTIMRPVVDSIRPLADSKKVSLQLNLKDNIQVYCDRNFTAAVLRNLIMNALKFSPKEESILISAVDSENKVVFSIKDRGIGIPQSIKERLFKADNSIKRKGTEGEPGTGLGLMLSKDFILKLEGEIWFESREGEGTSFYFSLPKAP